jgi:hypothetical protein
VPLSFGETVAADPALRPYLPDFTYSLLDLGQVPDERLSSQSVARGGLRVLKYSYRPDGQAAAVLAAVDDLTGSGFLLSAFIYISTGRTMRLTGGRSSGRWPGRRMSRGRR